MIPKCAAPDCNGTPTKNSHYCLTCEHAGLMRLAVALEQTMDRPAPVTPPARIWDAIAAKIKQGEKL